MSLFDMGADLLALATDTVERQRLSGAGHDSHGRATTPTVASTPGLASVQPASGRDLQRLPEGERSGEVLAVWTTLELRTADAATGVLADRLAFRGRVFEVVHVDAWQEAGGYVKALVMAVSA